MLSKYRKNQFLKSKLFFTIQLTVYCFYYIGFKNIDPTHKRKLKTQSDA